MRQSPILRERDPVGLLDLLQAERLVGAPAREDHPDREAAHRGGQRAEQVIHRHERPRDLLTAASA